MYCILFFGHNITGTVQKNDQRLYLTLDRGLCSQFFFQNSDQDVLTKAWGMTLCASTFSLSSLDDYNGDTHAIFR